MNEETQFRALKLLEEENTALRAQLKEIRLAVAGIATCKTDDSGRQDLPFFCESYLYEKLGKEDARTVLYALNNLRRMTVLDLTGAHALLAQTRAYEDLYSSLYDIHIFQQEGVPEKPVMPRAPHRDIKRKDMTPQQRKEVDDFYGSKEWTDYSKARQEYLEDPKVKMHNKLSAIYEAAQNVDKAERAVRERVSDAEMVLIKEDAQNE